MATATAENGFSREMFENWTVQMRKGVLDLCILKALSSREWYGYALVKALVAVPGVGVAEGSIYPLLARLEEIAAMLGARLAGTTRETCAVSAPPQRSVPRTRTR